MNPTFLKNLAMIKKAAVMTNKRAGELDAAKADAIITASDEVMEGKFREAFVVDAIQGGAGTSANMNMNEVIANRACELLGAKKGDYSMVHPNDHVNMAQSTNDVIPTAGKLTVLDLLRPLEYELVRLEDALMDKATEFDDVIKMGRTQLQDAVPMRLGQSFHAWAVMVRRDHKRLHTISREMLTVNLGGTAIGTAINNQYVRPLSESCCSLSLGSVRLCASPGGRPIRCNRKSGWLRGCFRCPEDMRPRPLQDVQRSPSPFLRSQDRPG